MTQGTTKGVPIDTDPTLAANSDQLVCSQKAIKTYVDVTIQGDALPVTATANQVLLSQSLAAPVWSTATYPVTAGAIGNVLTSDGTNWASAAPAASGIVNAGLINELAWYAAGGTTVSGLTTANRGVLVTSNTGVPSVLGSAAITGQLLQSNAAAAPSYSTSTYPPTNDINTLLYASAANVMSALATANNGVLVTSAGGIPSISSTLPSGIAATNMSLTTPTLGVATATSLTFSPTTGGIIGTTTNDNTGTGNVGEFVTATGTSVSLAVSNTIYNVTSVSLTAGDWNVWANILFSPLTNNTTLIQAGVSLTTAALPGGGNNYLEQVASPLFFANTGGMVPMQRISIASTTTIYLCANSTFSGVTAPQATGILNARRIR